MAAFGYSIGDFIAVVQLAYKVYDGCKTSVEEYKDIGRDVGNTHIVLKAIQRYWKEEESRGRALIVANQEELKQLAENSDEILSKIQEVLDKHRMLGDRGGLRDKLKWSLTSFVRDIGPQRDALQRNTHALAIFNATLTAENASGVADQQIKMLEAHGQLLKFLVTRYFEFQTGAGDRIAPAFSQVAVKDITENEDESWQNIDAEFKAAGFSPSDVQENRGFIREWITTVIPEDSELDTAFETSSTIVEEDQEETGQGSVNTSLAAAGLSVQKGRGNTKRTPEATSSGSKQITSVIVASTPPPLVSVRPGSASSRRSQESTWQDLMTSDNSFAAQMIAKIFKSKYGEDCEEKYVLPIKRAFHHLDWSKRGYVSFGEVQKCCTEAGVIASFSINPAAIGALAKKMDTNKDNEVEREEFIEIVKAMRQIILEKFTIAKATEGGKIDAGVVLKNFFDTSPVDSMLPPSWQHTSTWDRLSKTYRGRYRHDLLSSVDVVAPLQRNFTNASFLATGHCSSQITSALRDWRVVLQKSPTDDVEQYVQALNNVLRATARFHEFDGDNFPHKRYPFDRYLYNIDVLPLEQWEDFASCPVSELQELVTKCWALLDPILGFVYDVKPEGVKQVFLNLPSKVLLTIVKTPPSMAEWRRLRMLERSRRILRDLQQWDDIIKIAASCQDWFQKNEVKMDELVKQSITTAKDLHRLQREFEEKTSVNTITIYDLSMGKLKRQKFRDPSTLLRLLVDGDIKSIDDSLGVRNSTTEPNWWLGEIKIMIGYFQFNITDITNFEGYSNVMKTGNLVVSDSSPLKGSPPQVSVQVVTSWTMKETDWNISRSDSLANTISTLPLPPGWEARRSKNSDVYFFNPEKNEATACLWTDSIPSAIRGNDLTPLPEGWKEVLKDKKLLYRTPDHKEVLLRPRANENSTFQNVIKPKEYGELQSFFPQYLIDDFKKP